MSPEFPSERRDNGRGGLPQPEEAAVFTVPVHPYLFANSVYVAIATEA